MQGIWKKAPAFICLFGVVGIASLLVNLDPNLVRAQEAKGNLPHLGDLMNNAMQIHHTKLWRVTPTIGHWQAMSWGR